jgi:hypothetical protein
MKIRPAGWCWIGLAAGVAVADVILIRKEQATMSEVFGDRLAHQTHRWLLAAAWVGLTAHLFGKVIPEELHGLDPISHLARLLEPQVPPAVADFIDRVVVDQ